MIEWIRKLFCADTKKPTPEALCRRVRSMIEAHPNAAAARAALASFDDIFAQDCVENAYDLLHEAALGCEERGLPLPDEFWRMLQAVASQMNDEQLANWWTQPTGQESYFLEPGSAGRLAYGMARRLRLKKWFKIK